MDHQDFLLHLEEFDQEEVIPTEADLHMRYVRMQCSNHLQDSTWNVSCLADRDHRDQSWLKGLICKTCQYCPAVQTGSPSWLAITDILQSKVARLDQLTPKRLIIFCQHSGGAQWLEGRSDRAREMAAVCAEQRSVLSQRASRLWPERVRLCPA